VNTRHIAADYRLTHWAQIMRDRAEKRLSIRLYCEQAEIHENTYFYWQRKLRDAACSGIQTTAAPDMKSLVPKGWTALSVKEEPLQAQGLTVEVSGCRIRVLADTDPMLLVKVCRALKAL
jgi:putative transposase